MMRLTLTAPNGEKFRLDTPDPALVGVWLKALFDSWGRDVQGGYMPSEFALEVR